MLMKNDIDLAPLFLISNQLKQRQFERMQTRNRNIAPRRAFGRDITNMVQRRSKNASLSQNNSPSQRNRNSRSTDYSHHSSPAKDPIKQYHKEIIEHLIINQRKQKRQLSGQVTPQMREILIDWLVDVHLSFQLREQTLHLCLVLLSQFCSGYIPSKNEYQLVGITCLWIASKYQEIYPPRMNNFVEVTAGSYSVSELKAMEGKIILALNFDLSIVTPLHILEAFTANWMKNSQGKMNRQSKKSLCMSKYLIQLSLFTGLSKQYCMKTIVLTSIMLSDSILKVKSDLQGAENHRGDKQALMACFKDMCHTLQSVTKPGFKLHSIRKKYSTEKFAEVAKFRIEPK